jgi:hypothetical protein
MRSAKDNTTVSEANSLLKQVQKLPFIISITVWYDILDDVNKINKYMQSSEATLDCAQTLCKKSSSVKKRSRFSDILELSKSEARKLGISTEFTDTRIRKKSHFDETCEDKSLTNAEENFKVSFYLTFVDTVISQLEQCFDNLPKIIDKYDFMQKIKIASATDLVKREKDFHYEYSNDVSDDICSEISILQAMLKTETILKPIDILRYIIRNNLEEIFPNMLIAIRIFLSLPVTVAEAERSFSKLGLIKTYLRSNMSQERLNVCAILSIATGWTIGVQSPTGAEDISSSPCV